MLELQFRGEDTSWPISQFHAIVLLSIRSETGPSGIGARPRRAPAVGVVDLLVGRPRSPPFGLGVGRQWPLIWLNVEVPSCGQFQHPLAETAAGSRIALHQGPSQRLQPVRARHPELRQLPAPQIWRMPPAEPCSGRELAPSCATHARGRPCQRYRHRRGWSESTKPMANSRTNLGFGDPVRSNSALLPSLYTSQTERSVNNHRRRCNTSSALSSNSASASRCAAVSST